MLAGRYHSGCWPDTTIQGAGEGGGRALPFGVLQEQAAAGAAFQQVASGCLGAPLPPAASGPASGVMAPAPVAAALSASSGTSSSIAARGEREAGQTQTSTPARPPRPLPRPPPTPARAAAEETGSRDGPRVP